MIRRVSVAGTAVVCLVVVGLVPAVQAQATGEAASLTPQVPVGATSIRPPHSPEWGIAEPIAYNVPAWTFNNRVDAQHDFEFGYGYIYHIAGSTGFFDQAINLPSGAVIDGVTTFFYDQDPTENVLLGLYRVTMTGTAQPTNTELLAVGSTGTGGFQAGYHALAAPETVRNYEGEQMNSYLLWAMMFPSGYAGNLAFGGVTVWYRLQISPAPASATFSDVPTDYWAFRHVEALAASGITAGCGGGNFCPENYVKRSEMAVYLAKALGLHWPDGSGL